MSRGTGPLHTASLQHPALCVLISTLAGCSSSTQTPPHGTADEAPAFSLRVTYYPSDRPPLLLARLESNGEYVRVPGLEAQGASKPTLSHSRVPASRARETVSRIMRENFCRPTINEYAFGGSYYEIRLSFPGRHGHETLTCVHRCADQLVWVDDYRRYVGMDFPSARSEAIRSLIRVPLQELRDLDVKSRDPHH